MYIYVSIYLFIYIYIYLCRYMTLEGATFSWYAEKPEGAKKKEPLGGSERERERNK